MPFVPKVVDLSSDEYSEYLLSSAETYALFQQEYKIC